MGDPNIVPVLVRKRANLAGEIERLHTELRNRLADLETVDAALRLFDPDYHVEAIKPRAQRPPDDWAKRGEMMRHVLSILRQASAPMTTRDIALELMATRALDTEDRNLMRLMVRRVGVSLRGQRDLGRVKAAPGAGQFMYWEMVR